MDALEDERLREYAREVVFGIWNEQKRDAKLDEIFHGVRRKIASDLENGEWPRIWNAYPIKRTVDRRVNELADGKHPRFWGEQGFPVCVSLRPGFYRPNPRLFDDAVRADIASHAGLENTAKGESGSSRENSTPVLAPPNPLKESVSP